jgi:hypothetical protein
LKKPFPLTKERGTEAKLVGRETDSFNNPFVLGPDRGSRNRQAKRGSSEIRRNEFALRDFLDQGCHGRKTGYKHFSRTTKEFYAVFGALWFLAQQ